MFILVANKVYKYFRSLDLWRVLKLRSALHGTTL